MEVYRAYVDAMLLLRQGGFLTDAEYEKVSTRIQKWKDKIDKKH